MKLNKKCFILIAMLIILPIYFFLFFQKGMVLYDTFLPKSQTDNQIKYSGRINGYNTSILVEKTDKNFCTIMFSQESTLKKYRLESNFVSNEVLQNIIIYENDEIIFKGKYDAGEYNSFTHVFEYDGSPYIEEIAISINAQQEKHAALTICQLVNLFCEDYDFRGNFSLMLFAFVIILIWAIDICFPRFFFLLRHFLSVENSEPSKLYFTIQHLSWTAYPIISSDSFIIESPVRLFFLNSMDYEHFAHCQLIGTRAGRDVESFVPVLSCKEQS